MIQIQLYFTVTDKDYATIFKDITLDDVIEMLRRTNSRLFSKFAAGQREHGGRFYDKPSNPQDLTDELLDAIIYRDHEEQKCHFVPKINSNAIPVKFSSTDKFVPTAKKQQ